MCKQLTRLAGLVIGLSAAALTGCSSFVQQAAPVEAPSQASTYRASASPANSAAVAPQPEAQASPYRAESALRPAPVAARVVTVSSDDGKTHVVQPGENLFRIALSHGLKYKVLASWNNLADDNIQAGQVLRLTPPLSDQAQVSAAPVAQSTGSRSSVVLKAYPKAIKLPYTASAQHAIAAQSEEPVSPDTVSGHTDSSAGTAKAATPAPSMDAAPKTSTGDDNVSWAWPVNGKVLRGYSDSNKGIDIGGRMGQAILAAGDGKVVYSGNGLRGYGKLIIIKHNKSFLSAYAHNSQLLVKEGQTVKKGQKIAEMGNSDADQVKLHFEIRRFGKPIDPMQYLNSTP